MFSAAVFPWLVLVVFDLSACKSKREEFELSYFMKITFFSFLKCSSPVTTSAF